jgi:hypothetical protein
MNPCPSGQVLKSNGTSWACAADEVGTGSGGVSSVSAAAPLQSTGGASPVISLGSCASGQVLKWNGSAWTCAADENQTYSAGTGLALAGSTFSADSTYLQRRVTGTCGAGSSIRTINADGSVVCETDDAGGAGVTSVTASAPLASSGGSAPNITLGSCAANQVLKWNGSAWACAADASQTYAAGTGLALAGSTFSADSTYLQRRVTGTCGAGSSIRTINADGSVVCETDDAGGAGVTSVTASAPLASSGGSAPNITLGSCATGQVLKWNGSAWACAADASQVYAAGTGLALSGSTFSADTAYLQRRVSGTCAAGTYVTGIAPDGTVTCGAPVPHATTMNQVATGITPQCESRTARFCGLAYVSFANTGTDVNTWRYCTLDRSGTTWTLCARTGTGTNINCQAHCFD